MGLSGGTIAMHHAIARGTGLAAASQRTLCAAVVGEITAVRFGARDYAPRSMLCWNS
jgi:hypothetical protein